MDDDKRKRLMRLLGVRGKVDDRVYYKLGKKYVDRKEGKVSAEAYATSPPFEEMRLNQGEFGLSSPLAAVIRHSLGKYKDLWCGRHCSGKLTGKLRRVIQMGAGEYGKRWFEGRNIGLLDGFPLDEEHPKRVFLTTATALEIDRQEIGARLYMGMDEAQQCFGRRPGKEARVVVGLMALSEIRFDDGYYLLHPEWHGKRAFGESLPLGACEEGRIEVSVTLDPKKKLPKEAMLLGVVGWV